MPNKLILPDNILLQTIQKQHLYCDKKSKDPHTSKKKLKYKLAGNCLLTLYFFHVLTTSKDACKKSCTVSLNVPDWEGVVSEFKSELRVCYCDLTKFENIERVILLQKMKDANNGFPYVGKLCNHKYKKMQQLRKILHKLPYVSDKEKNIVDAGLSLGVDEILSKLIPG